MLAPLRRAGAVVLALVAFAAVSAAPAAAGYVFVDDSGDEALLAGGRVKMVPKRADAPILVLDMPGARIWVANPGQRTFWDGTIDEYCASVRGLAAGAPAGSEEPSKGLSPAEREQVQARMKAAGAPPAAKIRVVVERTAHTETIAGWPTRKYRVLADGTLHEELWLTTDPGIAREFDVARAPETFGRMMACVLGGPLPGGGVEGSDEYRQLYAQGWPLRSVYYGAGGESGGSTVTRAERRDIAEREFATPAGYRRAPFADVVGAGTR